MLKSIACALLVCGAATTPAVAQNVDAVMERANKINQFMALFEHSDPSVRAAAFEEGITASDPLFKKRAIEAGLASKDTEVRAMAIIAYLQTGPVIILEVAQGVRLSPEQTKGMPVQVRIDDVRGMRPDRFRLTPGFYTYECQATTGSIKCLNGSTALVLTPAAPGSFTGTWGDLPVIYKYK